MQRHASSLVLLLLLVAASSSTASDDTGNKQQEQQSQQQQNEDVMILTTDTFADVIERQSGPALVRHGTCYSTACAMLCFAALRRQSCLALVYGCVQVMFMITDCQACHALMPDLQKVAANLKVQQQLHCPAGQ
jgi:hypothetical protein